MPNSIACILRGPECCPLDSGQRSNVAAGTPVNLKSANFTRPSNFLGPFLGRFNVKFGF
jgi:hypothetical protein